ncbi:MAG TPA: DsbA family oxidoreductase [Kofleriaceae bacterium]|nr:DsbA family oxidoreductase [Kofleriaceae bacterium]
MEKLEVEVWSDIACPWCYVGKRRLQASLEQFPRRDAVKVVWRSFQLDPAAPAIPEEDVPVAERLAAKYGVSVDRAREMMDRAHQIAAAEGIELAQDRVRASNTFDAHRVVHLAAQHGLADAAVERLFRAHHSEGERLGDREVLARLGGEVGLDPAEVRAMLAGGAYAGAVRDDQARARALGVRGVPFFVFGGRYALSGAQPAEVLGEALDRAWRERGPQASTSAAPGCEIDASS